MLTKPENLKYQLETLASYKPSDIDNPEFEVAYEDGLGNEGLATVCCVGVAKEALDRINALEEQRTNMMNILTELSQEIHEERRRTGLLGVISGLNKVISKE